MFTKIAFERRFYYDINKLPLWIISVQIAVMVKVMVEMMMAVMMMILT